MRCFRRQNCSARSAPNTKGSVPPALRSPERMEFYGNPIKFTNTNHQYYQFAKSTADLEHGSIGDNLMSDRVYIFDTTLRDGEQSPGCSMTVPEKLRMARKLVELGVDILEAGFPIASEGEYEAVTAVSKEFP